MRRFESAAVAVFLAAAGCASGEPEPPAGEAEGEAVGGALASTLNVQVEGDSVRLALLLTNAAATPVVLEYPTAQRTDFAVETPSGEVVWQWSVGMAFAQMVGVDTVAAGGTREYEAVWAPGVRTGRHIAVGRVTSSNQPVELRTEFEIPER